jgi:general stress protein 26
MTDTQKIEDAFWKSLRSDMTVMLVLCEAAEDRSRPMTAQIDGDEDKGPVYFFGGKDSSLYQKLGTSSAKAEFTHVPKGHDLFAAVEGDLSICHDNAVLERLWNPFVAAWYPGGKDDANLVLFKMDIGEAKVWLNGNSLVAGIKMLFGVDPKQNYSDKVATLNLA